MHLMYFTERPYRDVPEDEVIKNRSFFGVPNRFYDAQVGARLYNEYLDEDVYAEEVGFDAIMLNEHHGTPFCMGAVMNVEASILARITKRARIVLLGNPLPTFKNPLRIAEELATIDLSRMGAWSPDGSAALAASRSSTRPIPPTIASASRKPTISFLRHGRVLGRSDGRASTSTTATSIRG